MFSVFVKSYSISPMCLQHTMRKALFLHFFMSLLIIYLITLSLKKKLLFWSKISGLSLRAGGWGFPPATQSMAPGYFRH